MGKSPKIQDVQENNKEFQDFLTELQNQLGEKAQKEAKDFADKVEAFYQDKTDHVILAEGEKYDYSLSSEVGASTLKDKVTTIVDTLFGLAASSASGRTEIDTSENGSIISDVTKDVKDSINLILNYKEMAAAVVTNLLIEVLGIFSSSLDIKSSHNYSAEAIAPGLRLHLDVYADSCVSKKFFKNEVIVENYVRFQLIYSPALAALEGNMYTQLILESRKTKMAKAMAAFDDEMLEATMNMKTPIETLNMYTIRSEMLHKFYDSAQKDLENLLNKTNQGSSADALEAAAAKPVLMQEREKAQREILNTIRRAY